MCPHHGRNDIHISPAQIVFFLYNWNCTQCNESFQEYMTWIATENVYLFSCLMSWYDMWWFVLMIMVNLSTITVWNFFFTFRDNLPCLSDVITGICTHSQSSSRSGWQLRNIHISLLRRFFLSSTTLLKFTIYMSNTGVSYRKQELLILPEHLYSSPGFWWGRFAHPFSFSVLCCILIWFVFVLCCVPNVASFPELSIPLCPFGFL